MIGQRVGKWARPVALLALILVLGAAAGEGNAAPACKKVKGTFDLQFDAPTSCISPVGICASGTLKGDIKGAFEGIGTSVIASADTPTTGVVFVTADVTRHTDRGDLFAKSAIALRSNDVAGEFAELSNFIGGTGVWQGASGYFQVIGVTAGTTGTGTYTGEICTP